MVITNTFDDALTRQCNEAVWIHRRSAHTLLNSKSEMNHPKAARITVEKKQNSAQPQFVRKNLEHFFTVVKSEYMTQFDGKTLESEQQ